MLKGSQITAFTLALTSFFVAISTSVAYAKQTTEPAVPVRNEPEQRRPRPICISSDGKRYPCPQRPSPPIPITLPELNEVTNAVAIEKLQALKASGKATSDDYILLGYFYSLEKKYDLSEANYLTALKLATDDGRKAIIEQELKKIRDVMREPELGGETSKQSRE